MIGKKGEKMESAGEGGNRDSKKLVRKGGGDFPSSAKSETGEGGYMLVVNGRNHSYSGGLVKNFSMNFCCHFLFRNLFL